LDRTRSGSAPNKDSHLRVVGQEYRTRPDRNHISYQQHTNRLRPVTVKGRTISVSSQGMEWGEGLCEFMDADGNEFDLKQPIPPTESKAGLPSETK